MSENIPAVAYGGWTSNTAMSEYGSQPSVSPALKGRSRLARLWVPGATNDPGTWSAHVEIDLHDVDSHKVAGSEFRVRYQPKARILVNGRVVYDAIPSPQRMVDFAKKQIKANLEKAGMGDLELEGEPFVDKRTHTVRVSDRVLRYIEENFGVDEADVID